MACLVLGTESCSVYILDPEAFTILDSLDIPSPPVFLTASGKLITQGNADHIKYADTLLVTSYTNQK